MKIRPVGAELFHADGQVNRRTDRQTGITKPIVVFRSFSNALKTPIVFMLQVGKPGTRGGGL